MNISQVFLSIGLLSIYCVFVVISIVNLKRLDKRQEKFNNARMKLLCEMSKTNSHLTCQILAIMNIIDESDKSKELYKETIDKIKKVIYPDCKAEIDNF